MNKFKVSIITPSYNQGRFIEETIKSVISQSYGNIEYIIIDGGSSDNTLEVIERYSNFITRVVTEPDFGQADAINKGIKAATGDLITWINSDDLLEPKAIEYAVAAFIEFPEIDFVYGNVNLIDESTLKLGVLKGKQVRLPSVFYNIDLPIPQQGSMWRSNVTDTVGLLNEKWHYVLDREFFLRICLTNKIMYIDRIFGSFRQHQQSKSLKRVEPWIKEMPLMYYALTRLPSWPYHGDDQITKKAIASSHIHAAYLAFLARKIGDGLINIYLACANYPAILLSSHIYSKPLNKFKALFRRR